MWHYIKKCLGIYIWNILQWFNRNVLYNYDEIEECARCRDCGRNVHDFNVPDDVWIAVMGSEDGVWCYDCFCSRSDKKLGFKWRMHHLHYMEEAMKIDVENLFTYHKPKNDQPDRYEKIRLKAKEMACVILENCPECADTSAAIRKLREAVMTANASIACNE